jgi:hypothetical protein
MFSFPGFNVRSAHPCLIPKKAAIKISIPLTGRHSGDGVCFVATSRFPYKVIRSILLLFWIN